MKRTLTILALALGFTITGLTLHSQTPAPATLPAKSPLEQLKAFRDANAKLLEQQTKTLQQLDELEKTSQALKVLGRRA
jgi:hypothetical protein